MQLLSPKQQVDKKSQAQEIALKRAEKISGLVATEEKKLNHLKTVRESEKEQIEREFQEFKIGKEAEREILSQQVENLKFERREALRPIEDRTHELNEREEKLIGRESLVDEREKDVLNREETADLREMELYNRFKEAQKVEDDAKVAIHNAVERDFESEQAKRASDAWIQTQKEHMEERWAIIRNREKEIEIEYQIIEQKRDQVNNDQLENAREKRDIMSRYQALEQAKKHLGIK